MSDRNFKAVRKQIRNIVQEEFPVILTNEFLAELQKKHAQELIDLKSSLTKALEARLDAIDKHLKTTLENIDTRAKEISNFVLSQSPTPVLDPRTLSDNSLIKE